MNTTKMKHLGRLALLGAGVSLGAANAATVNGQEYVHLVSADTSSAVGQNSFVLGTNWSDGEAPSAGKDYLVALQGGGGGGRVRDFGDAELAAGLGRHRRG